MLLLDGKSGKVTLQRDMLIDIKKKIIMTIFTNEP